MEDISPLTNKAKKSSTTNKAIILEIANIKEFRDLIEETRNCLRKIENFKFEINTKYRG